MKRPLLLDLYCCEGGAATGYAEWFDVIGVDNVPQPNYPFPMVVADALAPPFDLTRFDAIHASPPCQSYSSMSNRHGSQEPELIEPTRNMLRAAGVPYVIENVTGARAHMESPILLHGGHFGMDVYRPRLFESNIILTPPQRAPRPKDAVAVYGHKPDGRRLWTRKDGTELRAARLPEAREAMGMPWASWNGCREAIPPTYTSFIGAQLVDQLEAAA